MRGKQNDTTEAKIHEGQKVSWVFILLGLAGLVWGSLLRYGPFTGLIIGVAVLLGLFFMFVRSETIVRERASFWMPVSLAIGLYAAFAYGIVETANKFLDFVRWGTMGTMIAGLLIAAAQFAKAEQARRQAKRPAPTS